MLPLGPSPTYSITAQQPALPRPGEHLRLRPFKQQPHQDQKKKKTEHFKAPEKIQLSEEEIANLSDAQFKTLVIKTLTELVESVRKPDEKMKTQEFGKMRRGLGTSRTSRNVPTSEL